MYYDILKGKSVCSSGFCMSWIGGDLSEPIYKSKADLEKDCLAEPTCKAYDYSSHWGYGHLCDSVENYGEWRWYEICSITSRWNTMTYSFFLLKNAINTQ